MADVIRRVALLAVLGANVGAVGCAQDEGTPGLGGPPGKGDGVGSGDGGADGAPGSVRWPATLAPSVARAPHRQYDADGVEMLLPSARGSSFRLGTQNINSTAKIDMDDDPVAARHTAGSMVYWTIPAHPVTYASTGEVGWTVRVNMRASGGSQRYTWRDEPGYLSSSADVKNMEVTAYVRLKAFDDAPRAGVSLKIRGGSHSSSDGDLASCTMMEFRPSVVSFSKEYTHPTYAKAALATFAATRLEANKWVGLKMVSYIDPADAGRVVNQLYVDEAPFRTPGVPRNHWVLLGEFVDVEGKGPGAYKKLADWGGWLTTIRVDGAKDVDIALPSVREIVPPRPPAFQTLAGDFDADGRLDVLTLGQRAGAPWDASVALDLGAGASASWPARVPTHMRNGNAGRTYRVVVGDFDGDGRSDLVTLSPNGGGGWRDWAAIERSTGDGFEPAEWPTATAAHMRAGGVDRDYRVVVGDFDGDGRSDLATISPDASGTSWADAIVVERSTGVGFESAWWHAKTPRHMRNAGGGRDYRVLVGDFNGDGLSDLATVSPSASGGWASWVAIELSTGSGFRSTEWPAATLGHITRGGIGLDYEVVVGDFDGDGLSDLATVSPTGGGGWADWIAIERSTGTGFTSETWAASTPGEMRRGGAAKSYRILTGDFDGDGTSDLATVSPDAGGGWSSSVWVERSTGTGFTSKGWAAVTPTHMRNGGSASDYRPVAGDVDGDGRSDLLTVSPDGTGGWASWFAFEASTGEAFSSSTRPSSTPAAMRSGAP